MQQPNFASNSNRQPLTAQPQGQIGIIIILLMTVILALAISLSNRTAKEQQIAINQEESSRTFNAAESGIEQALSDIFNAEKSNTPLENMTDTLHTADSTIQYEISQQQQLAMTVDESATVEIALTSTLDNVTLKWWTQGTNCATDNPASLYVIVYNRAADDTVTARHFVYGDCSSERGDNFVSPGTGSDGYAYSQEITLQPNDYLVRVTPIYNQVALFIDAPTGTAQYSIISKATNIAENEVNEANSAKAISVNRSLPAAPAFMDFAFVSGGDIIQ